MQMQQKEMAMARAQRVENERQLALLEKDEIEQLYLLSQSTAHSYNHCLEVFMRKAKEVAENEYTEFEWEPIGEALLPQLRNAWIAAKEIKMNGDGTNEVDDIHPYVQKVVATILSQPCMNNVIRYHKEVRVESPMFRFDGAFTTQAIQVPTYPSILGVLELKAARAKKRERSADATDATSLCLQGQGQTVSYLSALVTKLDRSGPKPFPTQVAIFSNSRVIRFFAYKNGNPSVKIVSSLLTFMPESDVPQDDPPAGFTWLFAYLLSLSHAEPVKYVNLRGNAFKIIAVFGGVRQQVFMVAGVNEEERYIVKQDTTGDKHVFHLEREKVNYKMLSRYSKMNLLTLHDDLSSKNCLVLSPVGRTLFHYFQDILDDSSLVDAQKLLLLKEVSIGFIMQLQLMHESDCCHADIRPQNVIILPDKRVFLIDFEFTLLNGERLNCGNRSIFSSDLLLATDLPNCYRYNFVDDWESLCYTLIFSLINPPFITVTGPRLVENRRDYIMNKISHGGLLSMYIHGLIDAVKAHAKETRFVAEKLQSLLS
jgi:hypothetical protein